MSVRSIVDEEFDYTKFPELVELVNQWKAWEQAYHVVEFIENTGPESVLRVSAIDPSIVWTEWQESLVREIFENNTYTWGWHIVSNPFPQPGFSESSLETEIQVECSCCGGEIDCACGCDDCEGEGLIVFKAF